MADHASKSLSESFVWEQDKMASNYHDILFCLCFLVKSLVTCTLTVTTSVFCCLIIITEMC